jgi:hypothetical protein
VGGNQPTDPEEDDVWLEPWYDTSFLLSRWAVHQYRRVGFTSELRWQLLIAREQS